MAKALKILVCFVLLPLSIAAVVLATIVYGKREQVIARNQILTSGYIKLAPTIEDKLADPPEQKAQLPAKDISPGTVEFLDKAPDVSDFWTKKYDAKVELGAKNYFDMKSRQGELMTLYKKNALGDIESDPLTGAKKMDGEGTMQGIIEELFNKSKAQLERLGETRQMVGIIREELIDTITDLNKTKGELRKRTKTLDETKTELEKTVKERDEAKAQKEQADAARKAAEEKAADIEKQKNAADDQIKELNIENKKLKDKIKSFTPTMQAEPGRGGGEAIYNITPGIKGKVVAVNEKWNYALIELDDAFLKETMGDDLSKPAPTMITMSIKRGGGDQSVFITKARLTQIRAKDKHAIGDILSDWKQQPVKEGDVVFFP